MDRSRERPPLELENPTPYRTPSVSFGRVLNGSDLVKALEQSAAIDDEGQPGAGRVTRPPTER